nr:heavy metal sensor histidine kinase [Bowmanella yangjiangensis]
MADKILSLRSRMLLLVGGTLILCFVLVGVLVDRQVKQHFTEQDVAELAIVSQAVRERLASFEQMPSTAQLAQALSGAESGFHGMYFSLYDKRGQEIYSNSALTQIPVLRTRAVDKVEDAQPVVWNEQSEHLRGILLTLSLPGGEPGEMAVSRNIDFHQTFLGGFHRTLWLTLLMIWVITLLMGAMAIRLGLGPLHRLSRQISGITTERLDLRLDPKQVSRELSELVVSFNQMISEVELGFERLKHFSADIAHELRTPLTVLAMQTQVALNQARNSDEYREVLYSNLEEYERLTAMVKDMLWLAKTDNGLVALELESFELADEVDKLAEYMGMLSEDRDIRISRSGQCFLQADRGLIQRALSNLLSNAIRHAREGTEVSVLLSQTSSQVQIEVINLGDSLTEEQQSHLFERFYRANDVRSRRTEGTGLGLALVKSIVELHQGKISVASEQGAISFKIVLPAARLLAA